MSIFSDIRKDIAAIPMGEKKLRDFGYLIGGLFIVLAVILFSRHGMTWGVGLSSGVGIVLVLLGFLKPLSLARVYKVWMSFGAVMGFFVFRGFLVLVYGIIFIPAGFFMRLFGRDALSLRLRKNAQTYWVKAGTEKDMRNPY